MKTKNATPKTIQKETPKFEFKKYAGIDAALLNLGIRFPNEKTSKS